MIHVDFQLIGEVVQGVDAYECEFLNSLGTFEISIGSNRLLTDIAHVPSPAYYLQYLINDFAEKSRSIRTDVGEELARLCAHSKWPGWIRAMSEYASQDKLDARHFDAYLLLMDWWGAHQLDFGFLGFECFIGVWVHDGIAGVRFYGCNDGRKFDRQFQLGEIDLIHGYSSFANALNVEISRKIGREPVSIVTIYEAISEDKDHVSGYSSRGIYEHVSELISISGIKLDDHWV